MNGRIAGTGSSPVLPTKSQRTKLWKRLRRLDRQITKSSYPFSITTGRQLKDKVIKLDQKRKDVRNKLKGYNS